MQDQLVLAIATGLATKGGEALIAGGGGLLGQLYRLVRNRFRTEGRGEDTLDAAVANPDETNRADLAEALARLLAADPDLEERVQALWRDGAGEPSAETGGVINQFSGSADRVVQARDIRGDVSF
ncbi:hypothetical protein I0C86_10465 [Plantactinospora sp. S1510]|uniref:Uncharacterized protein n=1 Tax=Plantactinospora alkalitolerans TaxID=2789879 RepID=A0ABS0GT73_9ACTN|nr:hypothetical protein [Plantactinospora alkalitolerans]MBF9129393.1 hypothetical protein [Plantactinospora alkalitolerans]